MSIEFVKLKVSCLQPKSMILKGNYKNNKQISKAQHHDCRESPKVLHEKKTAPVYMKLMLGSYLVQYSLISIKRLESLHSLVNSMIEQDLLRFCVCVSVF